MRFYSDGVTVPAVNDVVDGTNSQGTPFTGGTVKFVNSNPTGPNLAVQKPNAIFTAESEQCTKTGP